MERMVLVLGVSAGAGGARAMLTHSDQPHLPPIDLCAIPRRAGAGVEEPVFQAVRMMRRAAAHRDECITGIAVTTRSSLHADAIRDAAGRSRLTIVDEPLAQLRYLRFSGRLPDSGSVLLYDLGSSGLTITQADCRTDAILGSRHSTVLGGDGHDALLRWMLARDEIEIDKPHSRQLKEALSSSPVQTVIDPVTGRRRVVTRCDFDDLVSAGLHHSASFVRQLLEETGTAPEAVVFLGGCVRNPGIRSALTDLLDLPVIYDQEPEVVSARGAVLMATPQPTAARLIRGVRLAPMSALRVRRAEPVSRRKVVAALAVTASLGATVAGLLLTEQNPDRAGHHGQMPAPVEIAGTPSNPEGPK
ncbi:acetate and sugar kinases/Hsc70/actin family protein [Nocardia stercoris]|uniref:Molecular chaperone n=1 Tax=Nocardia stercoris TaxID=2483361 RepID=A0A3M2L2A0_9NOCA|nr:hypothetical protein [Nocardia stercoris]RMI31671.1 hypothetical protein EBN03_15775 [Nocardia stercoris]